MTGRAVRIADATPDGVIENFEDADADPAGVYEEGDDISTFYGGDTGNFNRQTTTVLEGHKSVEVSRPSSGRSTISSTDGLNKYPTHGDTFRVLIHTDFLGSAGNASTGIFFYFGVQSGSTNPDGYRIKAAANGEIQIDKVVSGDSERLTTDSYSPNDNTTYEYEISWNDTITFTLYDESTTELTSTSIIDTTYTGGGVGWQLSVSSADDGSTRTAWADYARII
jgi:hypothetical protein